MGPRKGYQPSTVSQMSPRNSLKKNEVAGVEQKCKKNFKIV